MMDNYNYYSDPRVQASMINEIWKVVRHGRGIALIEFDADWLEGEIFAEFIAAECDKLCDEKNPVTDGYRFAKMALDDIKDRSDIEQAFHAKLKAAGALQFPNDYSLYDALRKLNRERHDFTGVLNREYGKIYDFISHKHDFPSHMRSMGFIDGCRIEVDTSFEVCPLCNGHGTVVNPGIDAGGLTREDFQNDPDFAEEYFSGKYDVTCPQCDGHRVVPVPHFPGWLQKKIDSHYQHELDCVAERCAELRMGA